MSEPQIRVLIVEARFYSDLADELLRGAVDALDSFGAAHDVVTVPGALEIPGAIAIAESGAHRPTGGVHYDGYVALGTVIRGETYHFEIVSNESAAGISQVQLDAGLPVANGILTADTDQQANARAAQKGRDCAEVAVEMAKLLRAVDLLGK